MSKRFTETTKWDDPWYQDLKPEHKCFWQFILDKCDCAGIWVVNWRAAEFFIGNDLIKEEIFESFEERIDILEKGQKWFIRGFINFQYGNLSEKCKPHIPVIKILTKYKLLKGYPKGINTLKEKEQVKDKVKVKEEDKEKEFIKKELEFQKLTFQFSNLYAKEILEDFIRYWTEPNKSRTKLRCELQQTFDIKRRLITWSKNERFTKKGTIPNNDDLEREILDRMATGYPNTET